MRKQTSTVQTGEVIDALNPVFYCETSVGSQPL